MWLESQFFLQITDNLVILVAFFVVNAKYYSKEVRKKTSKKLLAQPKFKE